VTLYPGSSKGFTVDFSAVSGKFSSTFATTAESNHYTYGDGTSKIDFSSVSGDLKIK